MREVETAPVCALGDPRPDPAAYEDLAVLHQDPDGVSACTQGHLTLPDRRGLHHAAFLQAWGEGVDISIRMSCPNESWELIIKVNLDYLFVTQLYLKMHVNNLHSNRFNCKIKFSFWNQWAGIDILSLFLLNLINLPSLLACADTDLQITEDTIPRISATSHKWPGRKVR